ncbi:adapter protein CIKS [Oryzias melastigma]|uniref:E3 ubiquitin ligase TRAF3IP2 n=1 Tax=Oryzias melastigma TaxID=30732 RepID=A0A3B3BIF6_ORYME|nr:adapter protein CIKS [Oryzias melastigma]
MLPASVCRTSAPNSFVSSYLNTPEEDDETMNTEGPETSSVCKLDSAPHLPKHAAASEGPALSRQRWMEEQDRALHPAASSLFSSQLPHSLPAGYCQPTPFPSQVSLLHPSFASSGSGYPNSLPSYLNQKDDFSCSEKSCFSKSVSLPGQHGGSMSSFEQPMSLRSNPPSAEFYHHTFSPYSCMPHGPVCCPQHPADAFSRRPPQHPAYSPFYPGDCRLPDPGFTQLGRSSPAKERRPAYSMPLSLEQRRVFVTYEADDDKHVNEIINFVALLRHNGFDTHIDIFEQQFRSISKIDFMERYLSEKEYLIIIIISPKYYETVTASPFELENDERMLNTVYIHKQLQSEFIQNGSKNFRFIPILFPGAKKCHVPNWLQNTHVYAWPRDRDDILRRLMRVEKYNPPPIGELPTIVSIPI